MTSQYSFAQVPSATIPRSVFNRSHTHKTTFDAGWLIPFFVDEALPGDTFAVRVSAFARLATPIFPLMDNLFMDFHFFAVPNRLLWDNWKKMMGEQENPGDSVDYLVPQISSPGGGFAIGGLHDYFGVPTGINFAPNNVVSALYGRAYNQIWNEWFRDENLQTRAPKNTGNGPDVSADYVLRRRGKRHDYFTSCLPWPQKAASAVTIPLSGQANVIKNTASPTIHFQYGGNNGVVELQVANGTATPVFASAANNTGALAQLRFNDDNVTGLKADLTSATTATINQLREAFQIQKLLERDARGGTRYIELVKAHFGVTSPDARVQRPEYLGGASVPVIINPVSQTSSTDATTPQGNLSGYGVAAGSGIGFTKSFTEHCVLMGLVSVRCEQTYQQGLHKMFSRRTRYDFYWPAFAHLGEQAVLRKEIYATADAGENDTVFGYQERWSEYRYAQSKVTGKFRSADALSLDSWHLATLFSAAPTLNAAFIEENPPVARVVAVQTQPHFLFDSHVGVRAARPMPTYSVPGFIDRF